VRSFFLKDNHVLKKLIIMFWLRP